MGPNGLVPCPELNRDTSPARAILKESGAVDLGLRHTNSRLSWPGKTCGGSGSRIRFGLAAGLGGVCGGGVVR